MATKLTYKQGDEKKTPVDPTKLPNGTMLVRVSDKGREFPYANDVGTPAEPSAPTPPAET